MLYGEICRLQEENSQLKKELQSVKFNEHFLEHGNKTKKKKQKQFFTGLPDHTTFTWALNYCLTVLPCSTVLSKGSIFLLMKLRLALLNQDLAYRFNVLEGLVPRFLNEGLPA